MNAHIEVDDDHRLEVDDRQPSDNDSSLGDSDQGTQTTSLFSEIMNYREENGRRYHGYKDGSYLLPNDDEEQDRLDLHHHIFSLASNGKLYSAPIGHPARVLDCGTGTGIWAIDFGDTHPDSHVIGTDLSPIQPSWVAPNVEFFVEDAEDDWVGSPYDYIHIRMLSGAIKDYPSLIAKAYSNLNPGGYLEITEFEVWVHSYNSLMSLAPNIEKWQAGLYEAGAKIGRRMDIAVHLKEWIESSGFGGVVQEKITVPTGLWPKNRGMKALGAFQLENMIGATSAYGQAHFTRVLEWSVEEYEVLSALVKSELRDRKTQLYSDIYTVYGQKPLTAT